MEANKKYFDFRNLKGPSNDYKNRMLAKLDDFKWYSPPKNRNNRRKKRKINSCRKAL